MEDNRSGVIRGAVREPFHVTAGEISRILRDKCVDPALLQMISHQLPSPLEFSDRDSRNLAVIRVRGDASRDSQSGFFNHFAAVSASMPNRERRAAPLRKNAAVAATTEGIAMT